jgi:hypothetical protein
MFQVIVERAEKAAVIVTTAFQCFGTMHQSV